jgi:hypothetical protein
MEKIRQSKTTEVSLNAGNSLAGAFTKINGKIEENKKQ